MKICYVDEAGCTGSLPISNSEIQPVFVINGLILDYTKLVRATESLLQLKQRFFPDQNIGSKAYLRRISTEIKGSELRRKSIEGSRNTKRHANGYLQGIIKICEEADAKILSRVFVKGIGEPFNGRSVYTSSIQAICTYFQRYLTDKNDLGIVIVDSRLKHLNSQVAHSIFTQKFKSSGDSYDRIIELPVFSHSDNHAGLQLSDTICSGFICPIAIHTYCSGHIQGLHVRTGYADLKSRYAPYLKHMQYRYQEANGRHKGGIVVSDAIGQRSGALMFK